MATFNVILDETVTRVQVGENTAAAASFAAQAESSADRAALSAIYAGGFETPEYASQSAGNAATTAGQIFRVPLGTTPQTFNWYRRLVSGSELVSPLATTTALASPSGAGMIGFGQTTVAASIPTNVKQFGAQGWNGVSGPDDTAAFQAAIDSGATVLFVPEGRYKCGPLTVGASSALQKIVAVGRVIIDHQASLGSIALNVAPLKQFQTFNDIVFRSSGNPYDGLATEGVRFGNSCSYIAVNSCRFEGFSGADIRIFQCVYARITDYTCVGGGESPGYGISLETAGGIPCTEVTISQSYISGKRRGINSNGTVGLYIEKPVFEYCGSASSANGALHIIGGSTTLIQPYWEANYRNIYAREAPGVIVGPRYELPATAPNDIGYDGAEFGIRGISELGSNTLTITRIKGDPLTGGKIEFMTPVGVGTVPGDGLMGHYRATEPRVRYESVGGSRSWDTLVGGGGIGGGGWFSVFDATAGQVRFEVQPGTGKAGIRGDTSGMEFWLNDQRILTTRGSAIAAPTGGATVDAESRTAINALRAELARQGIIAAS